MLIPGLDGNKLVQVWNIARRFYLSWFRRMVNSTLDRPFLGVHYKKHISLGVRYEKRTN